MATQQQHRRSIIGTGAVLIALSGPGQTAGFSVFVDPLTDHLDVSRGQLTFAYLIGTLAAIVLSHPDRDHYGGLAAVAEEVTASEFWSTGETSQAEGFSVLLDTVGARGLLARKLAAGDAPLRGGEGMSVEVLHPPPTRFRGRRNDGSLVMGVRFGATRVLLVGDLERRGERALLRSEQNLGATILKVPHHGSDTSSTDAFVEAVGPVTAIASLGANNAWGFPARAVLERYEQGGALFATTADLGEIVLETDGQLERLTPCRLPGPRPPDASMGPLTSGGRTAGREP